MNGWVSCSSLKTIYGQDALYTSADSNYDIFTGSYWSSIQGEAEPFCIFMPPEATHVSVAILLLRLTNCPFADKSGGHAAFAGASSIQHGITISFEKMKAILLSQDNKTVLIGPGNLWGEVYETLSRSDVGVVGGRVYDVGVGVLLTGGIFLVPTLLHDEI